MAKDKRKRKSDGTGGSAKRKRKSDNFPVASNQNPVTPGTVPRQSLTRTELRRTKLRRSVLFSDTPVPKQNEPSTLRGGVGTIQLLNLDELNLDEACCVRIPRFLNRMNLQPFVVV